MYLYVHTKSLINFTKWVRRETADFFSVMLRFVMNGTEAINIIRNL